jgi:hypothetical protein
MDKYVGHKRNALIFRHYIFRRMQETCRYTVQLIDSCLELWYVVKVKVFSW